MKRGRVIERPRAEQDLANHYAYIAADKVRPAERFLKVAEETFELLVRMPGAGRLWGSHQPRLAGVRVYPMRHFRSYLVFYRPVEGGIEVLTILHGARDLDAALEGVPID
jgi:toxin ParE1/3/4